MGIEMGKGYKKRMTVSFGNISRCELLIVLQKYTDYRMMMLQSHNYLGICSGLFIQERRGFVVHLQRRIPCTVTEINGTAPGFR